MRTIFLLLFLILNGVMAMALTPAMIYYFGTDLKFIDYDGNIVKSITLPASAGTPEYATPNRIAYNNTVKELYMAKDTTGIYVIDSKGVIKSTLVSTTKINCLSYDDKNNYIWAIVDNYGGTNTGRYLSKISTTGTIIGTYDLGNEGYNDIIAGQQGGIWVSGYVNGNYERILKISQSGTITGQSDLLVTANKNVKYFRRGALNDLITLYGISTYANNKFSIVYWDDTNSGNSLSAWELDYVSQGILFSDRYTLDNTETIFVPGGATGGDVFLYRIDINNDAVTSLNLTDLYGDNITPRGMATDKDNNIWWTTSEDGLINYSNDIVTQLHIIPDIGYGFLVDGYVDISLTVMGKLTNIFKTEFYVKHAGAGLYECYEYQPVFPRSADGTLATAAVKVGEFTIAGITAPSSIMLQNDAKGFMTCIIDETTKRYSKNFGRTWTA
jgi:hypothetical protein